MAMDMGFHPGFSLNFSSVWQNSKQWDLSLGKYGKEAMQLTNEPKTYCVVASPPLVVEIAKPQPMSSQWGGKGC